MELNIDLYLLKEKGKTLLIFILLLSGRAEAVWGEVQRREQPPDPYIVLPSGGNSGSLSGLPPNPSWGLVEIDRATDLQAAAASAHPTPAPVFRASSQDPWAAAKPWTVVTPRSSAPGLDVVPLTRQAEGRAIEEDYSDDDPLPSYRPVYTSNQVDESAATAFKPSNPPTQSPPAEQAPAYPPPPAPVYPSPAPVYPSPAPTQPPLDPSAPLPLPPNPPPPPPQLPSPQLAPTQPPQQLSSNPLTRLKQGLRAQIEAVPQKLFNVATDAKKNVPKTYNTGEVVPAYHPVQQSNLGGLGAIIENVKIPTVYGTISPKLPNLPKLPKGPDLHTFLYGNQGYAPPPPDPVHPIYPSYPAAVQDPYSSYGVEPAKLPFPSPQLEASVGDLKDSVIQSVDAVKTVKQSIFSLVTSIPKVKVPTYLPITKGPGEWSEGAQTFWQYVAAMLGLAVFLAIQV